MKIELTKPKGIEEVMEIIDKQDWAYKDMIFLVVQLLDFTLKNIDQDAKDDIWNLIRSRYE